MNQHAFLAKLTARAGDVKVLDQQGRGGEALRQALERTPWNSESLTYDDDEDAEKVTVLDAQVPAAAQWILYCPRALYEQAINGGAMDLEYEQNATNFGTQKGWSMERWNFGRNRFEEISNMRELPDGAEYCMDVISKAM
jgi:hypothetical protein